MGWRPGHLSRKGVKTYLHFNVAHNEKNF